MPLKVLIVDDEPLAREAVSLRLTERSAYEVCGQAANGEDAIRLAEALRPDVIFLDIEMPEMNGIETARHLCALGPQNIIFVTAYDHFAIEAFQVNAVDYLLKPIKDVQFATMLAKLAERIKAHNTVVQNRRLIEVLEQFSPNSLPDFPEVHTAPKTHSRRIGIKDGGTTKLLEVTNIESVVSGKDYICIKVDDTVLVHRCTMKKFLDGLPPSFLRCHRSHTVNLDYVVAVENEEGFMELVCKSGDRHRVSRRYRPLVKKRLQLSGE